MVLKESSPLACFLMYYSVVGIGPIPGDFLLIGQFGSPQCPLGILGRIHVFEQRVGQLHYSSPLQVIDRLVGFLGLPFPSLFLMGVDEWVVPVPNVDLPLLENRWDIEQGHRCVVIA
jgi:hypothetical protein